METKGVIALISKINEKASRLITEELETRGMAGLSPSHGDILINLFRHGELPMKDLAERIGRKKNTVTVLVNKLIDYGYVEKNQDGDDSRYFFISLTKKGKSMKRDFNAISEKLITTAYDSFSQEEKESLVALLQKMEKNF